MKPEIRFLDNSSYTLQFGLLDLLKKTFLVSFSKVSKNIWSNENIFFCLLSFLSEVINKSKKNNFRNILKRGRNFVRKVSD